MSNDPIARGTNEVDPNELLAAEPHHDPSRRTFLQILGAGVAVASLPAIDGCAVESGGSSTAPMSSVDVEQALASATWVSVLRKDDLVCFSLGLVNLSITSVASSGTPAGLTLSGSLYLQRTTAGQPAFLITDFQPQHILETAYPDTNPASAPGGRVAVDARIAQDSRIVFVVPSNVTAIPYELGPILKALTSYSLNVSASAIPDAADVGVRVPILYGGGVAGLTANPVALNPIAAAMQLGRARRAMKEFAAANPEAKLDPKTPDVLLSAVSSSVSLAPIATTNPVSVVSVPVMSSSGSIVANPPVVSSSGGIVANPPIVVVSPPPPPTIPVQPSALETSIELPFRLQISPNSYAAFSHDYADPPAYLGPDNRVELWHTSLTAPQGYQTIRALWSRDPTFSAGNPGDQYYWGENDPQPFIASLYDDDRGDIVHLSSNFTLKDVNNQQRTRAIDCDRLMLSALGGWLDAHGKWTDPPGYNPSNPSASVANPALVAWDHVADMGRDNYVRVVRFGYLYPWGHKCVKVRVTQRTFLNPTNPATQNSTAYLWQHEYLIIKEPLRTYNSLPAPWSRGTPFTSVRFKTLVTPGLDIPADPTYPSAIPSADFPASQWVQTQGQSFPFEVEAFDQAGNKLQFTTSAIWLENGDAVGINAAKLTELNNIWTGKSDNRWMSDLKSQRVAYGTPNKPDDTRYATAGVGAIGQIPVINGLPGVAGEAPWVPQLGQATLAVDTIKGITGDPTPQPFSYNATYLANGFDGNVNVGEVMLAYSTAYQAGSKPKLDVSKMSNKSGGFVAPSLEVQGLSRSHGIVGGNPDVFACGGNIGKLASPPAGATPGFNPSDMFNLLDSAKLFGCFSIAQIISAVEPDFFKQAPKFLTQALQPIEELLDLGSTLSSLANDLNGDISDIQSVINGNVPSNLTGLASMMQTKASALGTTKLPGGIQGWLTQITQLQTAITNAVTAAEGLGTAVTNAITSITSGGTGNDPATQAQNVLNAFNTALATGGPVDTLASLLKPGLSTTLTLPIDPGSATQAINTVESMLQWLSSNSTTVLATINAFLTAEDAIENLHIKLDWSPTLAAWPPGAAIFTPNDPNGLHVGVEIRGKESNGQPAGADVYASLSNFQLGLIGANPVITLNFDKISFTASTNADPDVDCKFTGLHFAGALHFVEVLRQFIPLDGFSDPPDITVDTTGISATFGLPLPSISVGVFSLENISFNAGFQIPFIGKSLAVDFSFCTRESPFVLTVMMIGGGGFVGITITPQGVQKLEISLEATASLSVDFGIASGGISISVGIYLCIEANDCKLTGFVKFNGNVDVLGGIFSASITLDLELSYQSQGNKVIGTASLEIHVSLFCFGFTVSCSVTRKFHGDNNDPTFRDVMAPYSCASNLLLNPPDPTCMTGIENPWSDYVAAFVPIPAH